MAKNIKSLQLLRNGQLFNSYAAAVSGITSGSTDDGVIKLARYTDEGEDPYSGGTSGHVKTIFGIYHTAFDDKAAGYTIYESYKEVIEAIKEKIDTIAGGGEGSIAQQIKDAIDNLNSKKNAGESEVFSAVYQDSGVTSASTRNLTSVKLAGYTVGGDNSGKVAATDTLGEALGKLQGQINGMDKAASAVDGQVVTTVTQADGKVTETKANVKDLQLGGYSKDASATGDITSNDTINAALSKLENKAAAITIANDDGSINVTTGATGTDINVNIKEGEHVLAKDGNAGLYTNIAISAITGADLTALGANVKEAYKLVGTGGAKLGTEIKIYKDSSISKIYLGYPTDTVDADSGVITSATTGEAQSLNYVYHKEDGTYEMVHVDVSKFLAESEFKSGVTADNTGVVHGVVDGTSESFLTVGADGFKLSGVQDAIDNAVSSASTDLQDALNNLSGKTVTGVKMTGGTAAIADGDNGTKKITINTDGSQIKATGYEKGTAPAAANSAITATDTINTALSKLEHQVDKAKAAATTKVAEGTDAGNNMTIVPTTSETDSSVTYTINLTDVASDSALTAEIAARKAVDGQTGQTYAVNSSSNFLKNATSLNDADLKLDTELKKAEDEIGLVNGKYQAPSSGYASGATTVSQAIAQLNEQAMKNTIKAGNGITITEATDGTTVAVKLRDTTDNVENPLKFSNDGELYFDVIDAGTY